MEKKIITISREFGAGGRTIGHLVADKLGIPFYDGKLVEDIAKESGFAPKFGMPSATSFWSWLRKVPVSLWAGTQTTS